MNPLKVLLVTYAFPPAAGVSVLRAASLARYFPGENIRLDVLTTRNPSAVGTDPSLLSEIPREVTIHRTTTLDLPFGIKKRIKRMLTRPKSSRDPARAVDSISPQHRPGLLKRIVQDLLIPDPQVTWLPILTRAALRIVQEREIDLVLITTAPYSTLLLVEPLRKKFPSLSIVLDFRDEWLATAFDVAAFQFTRSERAYDFSVKAEGNAIRKATAVVAVTEAAQCAMRSRYPDQPESKFHLVPNGYDATRLERFEPLKLRKLRDKIVVTYVGSLYASTDPTRMIEALRSLPPDVRCRFTFRFIGQIEETSYRESLIALGEMVELYGFVPQREALKAMQETDYVLLVTHDRLNVSAKFYDYVGAGKPILGCVHPDGDARKLIEELRAGIWSDIGNVESMRQLFLDISARGLSELGEYRPDWMKIERYERKILARRYAALLHSLK